MTGRAIFGALAVGLAAASPVVGLGALVGSDGGGAWGVAASVVFVAASIVALLALAARA